MTRKNRNRVVLALCIAGLGFLAWRLGGRALGRELPRFGTVPAFSGTAVDVSRRWEMTGEHLRASPWIADFVFTTCAGPCPVLSAGMKRLQGGLPEGVRLVSFTVDPETDTPERLMSYARGYGAEPGRWYFVRMEPGRLYDLVRSGFKLAVMEAPEQAPGYRVTHTTKMVLVDGEGVIRGYYDGTDERVLDSLRRDAERLAGG